MRADPNQLRQVIGNLVDNAVKYSPDGGEVRVAAAANGGTVRFSVSDSGLGIPAGEQRRIFEKFYRLDPNMTRGIGGTGLGSTSRASSCGASTGGSGSTRGKARARPSTSSCRRRRRSASAPQSRPNPKPEAGLEPATYCITRNCSTS